MDILSRSATISTLSLNLLGRGKVQSRTYDDHGESAIICIKPPKVSNMCMKASTLTEMAHGSGPPLTSGWSAEEEISELELWVT